MDFEELAGLFHGGMEASESFMLYTALKNTVFFSMSAKDFNEGKLIFTPRPQEEIDSIIRKAEEKNRDAELRTGFLSRLKKRELLPAGSRSAPFQCQRQGEQGNLFCPA